MTTSPQTLVRLLLALSGWVTLLAVQLAPGDPLRVAVTVGFLLSCPGTAAMLLTRPVPIRSTSPADRLLAGVLALAMSAAISMLVAEVYLLRHEFTTKKVLVTLAALTTVLALAPRRRRNRTQSADDPRERVRTATRALRKSRNRRVGYLVGAGLLAFSTACGAASGGGSSGGGPSQSPAMPTGGGGSPAVHSPAAAGQWHQVFRDDFAGTTLDRTKWTTCYDWNNGGCTNPGNREVEWYLPGQVSVSGGVLSLTAERRTVKGSDGGVYPWVSGMVSTGKDTPGSHPHRTFTYGYYAAAIRVPANATGMFPAFWLVPLDSRINPNELDVAEFINTDKFVDMNLHFGADYENDGFLHHQLGPVEFAADYHVFALDWEPQSVTWYVDGVQEFQVTDLAVIPHEPMELVLNLAVGFQQSPPDDVNSAQLQVDWVEVWQH